MTAGRRVEYSVDVLFHMNLHERGMDHEVALLGVLSGVGGHCSRSAGDDDGIFVCRGQD